MSSHQQLLASINKAPRNKGVTAYFDLDKTVISGYSALGLMRQQVASKQLSTLDILQLFIVAVSAARGSLDFEDAFNSSAMMLEGKSGQSFEEVAKTAFRKYWNSAIYPEAYDLIMAHRKRGHRIVIISSATRYQVVPIAEELGISEILCSELEIEDGLFTGGLLGRPCWGEGKREAAEFDTARHGITLKNCYFYSDAWEDLPLLEQVGHPRVLNPDEKLEQHSKDQGWPVCHFTSRSRPGLEELVRTGLMWGSFAPAAALGVFSWLRQRSIRQAASTIFQQWSNLGLLMAGVDLKVKGEKHLWSHRPAIFIANHQSILDGFITMSLVHSGFTVLGKKEAGSTPFIGNAMEAAGFIMFDRSDSKKAREAADRVSKEVRNGYSLLLAVEGTRSHTNKLKPFKKGAFHIALQTRVPIVPIVIKNATELWPRGASFVRPGTVDVEILAPIATKDWKVETLQQHVNDVRALFLKALGQEEQG